MEENKDLIPHRFVIEAHWSIKEQKFVKYDRLIVEGAVEKLAGLINAVAAETPQVRALLMLTNKGTKVSMRAPDVMPKRIADEVAKKAPSIIRPREEKKDVSDMTDKEIEDMIRNEDKKRD